MNLISLFHSTVYSILKYLVRTCKYCLGGKVNLIKPYLRRNVIVPILSYPLAEYKSDFIEEILKYPYISYYSASAFMIAQPCLNCPGSEAPQCPHNPKNKQTYKIKCQEIKQKVSNCLENKTLAKESEKQLIDIPFWVTLPSI